MLGHIMGIPVEETVLQFAAIGAAGVTVAGVAGRRLLNRIRRRN